jgi:SAM-dependent methyltransferase
MAADLGCGGGRNAGELLKRYPGAKVTALDYSDLSVETARKYNKDAVASGRCTVQQGDVSALTLPSESYDLATAFETIYFWPGLEKCFRQVAGILRAGGYFLICNESDGTDAAGIKYEKIIDGMKAHTVEAIEEALKKAGFSETKTQHHSSKPWITVLARK